jgi:imidazolonepropionase-like amidohydrolase
MPDRTLTITNALIFDGESAELTEGSIRIADGSIAELGAEGRPTGPTIDARGRVVIPGLIDAHFHAYGTSLDLLEIESSPVSYLALAAAQRLHAALRRGFTTVRDVAGGDPGLARAVNRRLVQAPRYLYTGPALSQTGGHGDPRPGHTDHLCGGGHHMTEVVDGVDNLRRAVRDRFRRGAHAIKIMTSGGVVSPSDPIRVAQYSADEVRAVADEADRRGSYVAAHAYSPEAVTHSVQNGVRSIEHGNLLDEPAAALMREHSAFLVPTLAAYDSMDRRGTEVGLPAFAREKNREVLEFGQRAVATARAAGVPVGFGTDLMGALQDDQLHGLRLQLEVDGPLELLRSATSVNAQLLGRGDLGRIRVGAAADLIVLDGNPLEDPSVLWRESEDRIVVHAGSPL